jgi:hypothetical protein
MPISPSFVLPSILFIVLPSDSEAPLTSFGVTKKARDGVSRGRPLGLRLGVTRKGEGAQVPRDPSLALGVTKKRARGDEKREARGDKKEGVWVDKKRAWDDK